MVSSTPPLAISQSSVNVNEACSGELTTITDGSSRPLTTAPMAAGLTATLNPSLVDGSDKRTDPSDALIAKTSGVKAAASPDPRWPYLNRWSGGKSLAATIGQIQSSATKSPIPVTDPVETPPPVIDLVKTPPPAVLVSLPEASSLPQSNNEQAVVLVPPSSSPNPASNPPPTNPTNDSLEAPAAVHESPAATAAVQEASPVAPTKPTGIEAPPSQLMDPQPSPPSPPSLAGPDTKHDKAAIGDGQSQGQRNPSQPPSLKGAWTQKLKFLSKSAPGHSQQTHDQHDVSISATAEDNVRFPWAAKMNPSSRNLYRAVEPEYLEDGTPKVTIPPHVLLQGLENQKEYVLGQFFRCSPPPGGLIYAVLNTLWGRKCKISIRKLGDSCYLFHIPEESTRNWVLQRGLWHVDDCLMFVAPWTPKASLAIPEIKTIPVWVTLKNIPSILYSIRGISHIASGLGAPMATHKPRLDPFFMGEAKILVEVELSKAFPPRIAADDKNGVIWMVDVEYAWLPSTCTRCGQLGHKVKRCLQPGESSVVAEVYETHLNVLATTIAVENATPQSVPTKTITASLSLSTEIPPSGLVLKANNPIPLSRFISLKSVFLPKFSLRSIANHTLSLPSSSTSTSTSARRPISSMASSFHPEQARVPSALPLPAPPLTKFNIGLCQLSVTADKMRNISHAKDAIEDAASKGAKLVLLPEIWNSPYSNDSFPVYAEDIDAGGDASPSTAMLSEVSKRLKITIIGGSIPEKFGDRLYNTCCVFGSDGELKAKHRKIHLFDIDIPGKITFMESKTLTAGETPTIVDTDVGRIGIGICYDIRFQELAMIYAARGAHLLCYPGAFNMTTGPLHWELLQRARATDNQLYVATCSPARDSGAGYTAWGHSTLVGPFGEVLATTEHEEDIIIAEIDYSILDQRRTSLPLNKQRRGDLYQLVDVQRLNSK